MACGLSSASATAQKDVQLAMASRGSFATVEARDQAKTRMVRRHDLGDDPAPSPAASPAAADSPAAASPAAADSSGGANSNLTVAQVNGNATHTASGEDKTTVADPTADPEAMVDCHLEGNANILCGGAQMSCQCTRKINLHREETCCEVEPIPNTINPGTRCTLECRPLGTVANRQIAHIPAVNAGAGGNSNNDADNTPGANQDVSAGGAQNSGAGNGTAASSASPAPAPAPPA